MGAVGKLDGSKIRVTHNTLQLAPTDSSAVTAVFPMGAERQSKDRVRGGPDSGRESPSRAFPRSHPHGHCGGPIPAIERGAAALSGAASAIASANPAKPGRRGLCTRFGRGCCGKSVPGPERRGCLPAANRLPRPARRCWDPGSGNPAPVAFPVDIPGGRSDSSCGVPG